MRNKITAVTFTAGMALLLASGCSNSGGGTNLNQDNAPDTSSKTGQETNVKRPDEILILADMPSGDFESRYVAVLSKKYPGLKITQLTTSKEVTLANLVTATPFDLIDYSITNLETIIDLGIPVNLDPFVQKFKSDLNRFEPSVLKDVRSYSNKGELLLMPYLTSPFVLHYNKDIFDKFGVEYPKAGSTWEDLIELSKKVSRTSDGVEYRGLVAGTSVNRIQTQLSLPFVDAATRKSAVGGNPGWQRLYQTFQSIYSVPGNLPEKAQYSDGATAFIQTKTLAMYPNLFGLGTLQAIEGGIRVGITTFPVFKDIQNSSTGLFASGLAVSTTSKNQDFAFQVADYFSSEEAQLQLAKTGVVTPLKSEAVRSKLFEGHPAVKDLDLSVIYKLRNADPYAKTTWDKKALTIVQRYMQDFVSGKADMNTTTRKVDEEINKMVQENMR
ncbi:hypothetical protein PAESOLCIP111_05115 [Paenibacillus solanacearum]|uniref:Extracellular solute-binding protein n=1 Tax=Paenibacillus solanacearum TaxID=2048548 RepID=A0A916K762_9BACL|nr:extracellular solute-binding protein [Paenibacillus solanacearum]CAG7646216.1 hypothetical protein PAESOLCIP111_05115 [Paenibacillus solanacearum]